MVGHVFNIQKFCLHDGPGIRTTVFFKGCNLRCRWCANPESQNMAKELTQDASKCGGCGRCLDACPEKARQIVRGKVVVDSALCTLCGNCVSACFNGAIGTEGWETDTEQVLQEVLKDRVFYENSGGGVTFSGGEVLLQEPFAGALAHELHKKGLHVAVETAGAVPEETFTRMLSWADLVMMDLKHYDSNAHQVGTGLGNEQVLRNLQILSESGKACLVRIPVIPGFNDGIADAEGFAKLLREMRIFRVELLPFHRLGQHKYDILGRHYDYETYAPLQAKDLQPYIDTFANYGITAKQ